MTIEVMKQALEALEFLELEIFVELDKSLNIGPSHGRKAIIALRTAIKEAEKQEPVAWMYHGIRHDDTPHERSSLIWKPEYMDAMSAEKGVKATPLYTAPRQWQGLTDEEKHQLNDALNLQGRFPIIDAIEAKLKEKNT